MKRYEPIAYRECGQNYAEMEERENGDYVEYEDVKKWKRIILN